MKQPWPFRLIEGKSMRIAAIAVLLLAVSCAPAQPVDPGLVGTWEMLVPNEAGAALWVWEVRADGTYFFHAEGPGNIPSHHGTVKASKGKWVLNAANLDWDDSGTYDPPASGMVRMTSRRLGTGYWTRQVSAEQTVTSSTASTTSASSTKPDITTDPFAVMKNADEGIGEDGQLGHYDAAAAARMKAKNHDKINIFPEMGAVMTASKVNKPVVLFYSGGKNIDALIYSDAMVALAGRAEFGLDSQNDPDLVMTNAPTKSEFQKHVYPRILIAKPRFTVDQIINTLSQLHPGQKAPPLAEFEWEYLGAKSAQELAAMVGTELQRLGY
jgi:hypothetical protein